MTVATLGLDIGGANLKAAHSSGASLFHPFQLWKHPYQLADALARLLDELPPRDLLAVTMTGELCDCFETKREGVRFILDAVARAAGATENRVWQSYGRLVTVAAARENPLLTASANWLALATYAGRFAPTDGALIIDIGSTTTDIVPLMDGVPVPRGRTDPERLHHHELVYTGVRRTPACALLGSEAAAELFATTLDAYLVLGDVQENAADFDTADGRSATRAAAHARLARMICSDQELCSEEESRRLAQCIRACQIRLVRDAVSRVAARQPTRLATVIQSGTGEFLIRAVLDSSPDLAVKRISLAEQLGPDLSHCACAYALAVLAAEGAESANKKTSNPVVVKVGGSLFDLDDLGTRLTRWLEQLGSPEVVLVPGGGAGADVVRDLDKRHRLGEEKSHWLALKSLAVNACFLRDLLPGGVCVHDVTACAACWSAGKIPVLDPYAFALADEGRPGALPHSWMVTSDSIAARVARLMGICQLILLKSVTAGQSADWVEGGKRGLVDSYFAKAADGLAVRIVNLRNQPGSGERT